MSESAFQPPPGPPPSRRYENLMPPPSHDSERPPPYHDWMSIPDTALLPPPPTFGHKHSPSSNAELSEAVRAHRFCELNSLRDPHQPTEAQYASVQSVDIRIERPREYQGSLSSSRRGCWDGSTKVGGNDACLTTSLPLYFAMIDSPLKTEQPKTIYFELHLISFGQPLDGNQCSLALGFCAFPYPPWRMPGWERGSLAIHSDDGRRYVNDTDGGKDFTRPFKAGERVGIGIVYSCSSDKHSDLKGEVFFTRNGKREGGWMIHEELDGSSEFGILGLDGKYDLYGAIGTFGRVSFEVIFDSTNWWYRP